MRKHTKARSLALVLALPLVFTGFGGVIHPATAQNDPYYDSAPRKHKCANHKKKKKNKILGALGGAVIGGFIGRKIDGGEHHEAGTIAGAAGGAFLGQAIAGKLSSCDRYLQDEAAIRSIQTGETHNWSNEESGFHGSTKRAQSFVSSDGRQCNTIVNSTSDANGTYNPETVILCKNKNGSWDRL